ncbi:MAG: DUF3445 domain-containing protein [Cyclobacteriaceae bacterium]
MPLATAAQYRPFASGRYTIAPGLHALTTDFGNGPADQYIFQLDEAYPDFIANKAACRREGMQKYYVQARERPDTLRAITRFIAQRLAEDYPEHCALQKTGDVYELTNRLRGLRIRWDNDGQLLNNKVYASLWDALADQVPEDLALWQTVGEEDYLSTIHLCAPNHWAPADKVGKPFSLVHQPVAEMETLRRRYLPMLRSLLKPNTWVRFAWGLGTDTRLNHHPQAPSGLAPEAWSGRSFEPADPQLFVRIERQTLTGFPEVGAVLFTIRTYFEDVQQLSFTERQALAQAVETMSEATLRYKGLFEQREQILAWLTVV